MRDINDADTLLTPAQQAAQLGIARTTLLSIVEREGLPAILLSGGGERRRILRFNQREVSEWLAHRRKRQIERTLSGERYARRSVQP